MLHHRLQLLTQLDSHLGNTLSGLVKTGLNSRVLNVVFLGDGRCFLKSPGSFLLLPFHHIQIASESRDDLRCAGTVLAHILEHWSQHVDVAQFVQGIKQHQKAFVGTAGKSLLEFLRIHTSSLDNLILLLEHIHDELGNGRCRHLYGLSLTIQHGCKAHDLRDSHLSLGTDTCHSLGEVGQVRCSSRTVL